jgi:hypothetical protein
MHYASQIPTVNFNPRHVCQKGRNPTRLRSGFGRAAGSFFVFLLLAAGNIQFSSSLAQGTGFTYQGRLGNNGAAAAGLYDFRFRLSSDALGNTYVGPTLLSNAVPVDGGLFTLTLDFGAGLFNGTGYWLQVDVRTNGGGSYTMLTPLQAMTPAPYALFAGSVSNVLGVIPSGGLSGSYGGAVTFNNAGNNFAGAFSGNGAGLSNVNAAALGGLAPSDFWQLGGNAVAPNQFLGSLNNQAVELRVNGQRALRLEPAGAGINVMGGWSNNVVVPGVTVATIGGGGGESVVSPGSLFTNRVNDAYGTIAGGIGNVVGNTNLDFTDARGSTVGGGGQNTAASAFSTIGGGSLNTVADIPLPNAGYSTIGGGYANYNAGWAATIAGGWQNIVTGTSDFIGGGTANTVSNHYGSVVGGYGNSARGYISSIGGGAYNQTATNGDYSVIGGGYGNQIPVVAFIANLGGYNSTIAGGLYNTIGSPYSTVSGGSYSSVGTNSNSAVIGGGYYNLIKDSSFDCTIGGGSVHSIGTNSFYATIGGGRNNSIADNATSSTIAGGVQNTVQSNGTYAAVGGGLFNNISGSFATVPGGYANFAAGQFSFAAGSQAKATNDGAFVWADAAAADFSSTAPNQFLIRAAGGVGIGTNNPASALHVVGTVTASGFSGDGSGLSLSASQISSGTLSDAQLSPNVALLNAAQTFSAAKSFSSGVNISTASGTAAIFGTGSGPLMTAGQNNVVAKRMWIGHSEAFPTWGIQYRDLTSDGLPGDSIEFLAGDTTHPSFGFVLGSRTLQGYNSLAATTLQLSANGNGSLGIGVVPSFQLQLSTDSAAKPNGGSWANSSDARVKKNIQPMTGALEKIAKLRGVTFEWIHPEDHANQAGTQAGFVAQEVEQAFPSWVQETPGAAHDRTLTPDGKVKSLSLPFEFDALVVEALREVRAEKDAQIAELRKANNALETRLAAVESALLRLAGSPGGLSAWAATPAEIAVSANGNRR